MSSKNNLFTPLKLRGLEFPNRLGIPAMCICEAKDGHLSDFYFDMYGGYATKGFGCIIQEATGITAEGIWDDCFIPELKRMVDLVHKEGMKIGIQLNHAGRKGSEMPYTPDGRHDYVELKDGGWELVAPSPIAYPNKPVPRELTIEEIKKIVIEFGNAAKRVVKCGYDFIEIHGAHGFLIHEFLSPLTNHRNDEYGKDKTKFLKEVCTEVRKVIPKEMPLFVRLSCVDYKKGGTELEDTIKLSKELHSKFEVDLIDCSSAGLVLDQEIPKNWDHQLKYAKEVHKCGIPTAAVGGINDYKVANDLIANDECNIVLIGKAVLRDAFFPRHAAQDLGLPMPEYHNTYKWATRKPAHAKY